VREILTRTCPTCGGEGVVLSEQTMAVEAERRLRKMARSSGSDAFLVKMNAKVASGLVGPGGMKLLELERETGKHFTLESVERMPLSDVELVREGTRIDVDGEGLAVKDGDEKSVKISEPHMYNLTDGVARLDGGYPVVVGGAIGYVGQQHKVRIDRATRTVAYASLLDAKPTAIDLPPEPGDYELPEFDREVGERLELEQRTRPRSRRKTPAKTTAAVSSTATDEAADAETADEAAADKPKPRRRSRAKSATAKAADAKAEEAAAEDGAAADADVVDATAVEGGEETATKKRRRGKRGGRGRSKATAAASADGAAPADADAAPTAPPADGDAPAASDAPADDTAPAPKPRTRRRAPAKKTTKAAAAADAEPAPDPAPAPAPAAVAADGDGGEAGERKRGLLGKILGS
jgi:predicted RNA-binding protein with TRAM domain